MFKKNAALLFLLAVVIVLSACSGNNTTPSMSCFDSLEKIAQADKFTSEMQDLTQKLANKYLNINDDLYTDIAMRIDTSKVSCDQVIFVTAKDNKSQKDIETALIEYKDNLIASYRDYIPEEVPKLNNFILKNKGLQSVFVVCSDTDTINKLLEDLWN